MDTMTNDHERIPVDDFLDVVADSPPSAVPAIVDIVSGFGGDAAATMLLEMIFLADPDFKAVWREHYAHRVEAEHAVMYALLRGFIPDPNDCRDDDFFEVHRGLERWKQVARQMLRFDARYGVEQPWLYGWAMWGRGILDAWDAGFIGIDELPGAAGFAARIEDATGKTWLHDLPTSLVGMRDVAGVDDPLIRRLERAVLTEVIHFDASGGA